MEPLPGIHKTRLAPAPRKRRSHYLKPLAIPLRLLSAFVDFCFVLLFGGGAGLLTPEDPLTGGRNPFAVWGGILFALLVLAWWADRTGRSPGKVLFGGRLIRESDPAAPIGVPRAFVRLLLNAIPMGFWTILGSSRRTAHDHLTDTSVIRDRR